MINLINFYDQLGNVDEKYYNPNGKKYNISHPCRIAIIGSSGSGKTNALINLISKLCCFEKFYLFVKLAEDDQLYDNILIPKLEEIIGCKLLEKYSDTLDDLPDVKSDEIDSTKQNLFVFDDFLDESKKDLNKISAYFTKARKKNCSLVFIGQDYFSTPVKIRRNCSHFIFTDISSDIDLQNIFKDLARADFQNFNEFKRFFKDMTRDNNMLIVYKNENGNKRYRQNFSLF